jgi:tartrate-resistant acid phosphatase type 5
MQDILLNRRELITSIAAAAALTALPGAAGAASAATALDFLVVGDWGRNGTNHQRDVAAQMGEAGARLGSRTVFSVGDNFYEDGVQSVTDPQWRTSFEDIYTASALQIPWHVALGNHDYRGVTQAQLDYSKSSARWRMPARYYKVLGGEFGAPHVDFFVIDTSPLVHKYREKVHSVIAENVASQNVDAQLKWLDQELGKSAAPWKLVIGHHTIFSGGSGHGDTPETLALIDPLLRKHRVQAYIHGHDHDLQHIRRGGVDYLCCGAGSEVRPVEAIDGTLFCVARSGFAAFRSEPAALTVEFRDYTGKSLYRAPIASGVAALKAA